MRVRTSGRGSSLACPPFRLPGCNGGDGFGNEGGAADQAPGVAAAREGGDDGGGDVDAGDVAERDVRAELDTAGPPPKRP
jgi:hypothetical protein